METEKYGHVSIARAVEFDFFEENEVTKSVRFSRFGEASLLTDGTENPLISAPEGSNFTFAKSGNRLSMWTDFGVGLTMNGMEITLRVPNPPYEGELEGLCGNNDGDKT